MSTMTLAERRETLVNSLRASKSWTTGYAEAFVDDYAEAVHLAQAVDVGIIREVAASIDLRAETYLDPQAKAWSNTLTRALTGEKAGRVDGWSVAAHRFLGPDGEPVTDWEDGGPDNGKRFPDLCPPVSSVQYAYIPASPAPDKEG